MRLQKAIVIVLPLGILAGISAVSAQEIAQITTETKGRIDFVSVAHDSTNYQGFRKTLKYTDQIHGYLEFPANVTGKVPAMIVMHGSGGPNNTSARDWLPLLREQGVATFFIDSFTGRGISETGSNQNQLSYTASSMDALVALKVLAKHPNIDRNRIGVIGFSRGGAAALYSAFELTRKSIMGEDDLKFALHLPFYAACMRVGKTTGVPIIHFTGDKDDTFNEAACHRVEEFIRGNGGKIETVVYRGVRHGFDRTSSLNFLDRVMVVAGKCDQLYDQDTGRWWNEGKQASYAQAQTYLKECLDRGLWMKSDYSAREDSRKRVKQEVEKMISGKL